MLPQLGRDHFDGGKYAAGHPNKAYLQC
jgi:hypothetical protein